jgi:hypothetical protein
VVLVWVVDVVPVRVADVVPLRVPEIIGDKADPPLPKQLVPVAHNGVGTGLVSGPTPAQFMPVSHGSVQLVPMTHGDDDGDSFIFDVTGGKPGTGAEVLVSGVAPCEVVAVTGVTGVIAVVVPAPVGDEGDVTLCASAGSPLNTANVVALTKQRDMSRRDIRRLQEKALATSQRIAAPSVRRLLRSGRGLIHGTSSAGG